jgi:hypothetical protein
LFEVDAVAPQEPHLKIQDQRSPGLGQPNREILHWFGPGHLNELGVVLITALDQTGEFRIVEHGPIFAETDGNILAEPASGQNRRVPQAAPGKAETGKRNEDEQLPSSHDFESAN